MIVSVVLSQKLVIVIFNFVKSALVLSKKNWKKCLKYNIHTNRFTLKSMWRNVTTWIRKHECSIYFCISVLTMC